MSHQMNYGRSGKVEIDLPPGAWLAEYSAGRGIADVPAAVAAALAEPLDFPPLAQAVVPGDRVAVAVAPGVPQSAGLVRGVVAALLSAGIEAGDISLVHGGSPTEAADLVRELPETIREQVTLVKHEGSEQTSLSYLGATKKDARPVYLNRVICDADVVIPVGCLRLEESLGYVGVHGGLYPTFADSAAQERYRAPISADVAVHQRRRRDEADEAAWMLGAIFTVQVVPGQADSVLHVLAGESRAVSKRGRQLCSQAWRFKAPGRASLVVASIEGGPAQQTWENFARALFAATQVVNENGAIVLCTELECPPGPALRRLAAFEAPEDTRKEILRDRSADAVSAALLVQARERARVYLLSGLQEDVVEDLGLGHVAESEQVTRLCRQHESCIVLAGAQHAVAVAE